MASHSQQFLQSGQLLYGQTYDQVGQSDRQINDHTNITFSFSYNFCFITGGALLSSTSECIFKCTINPNHINRYIICIHF